MNSFAKSMSPGPKVCGRLILLCNLNIHDISVTPDIRYHSHHPTDYTAVDVPHLVIMVVASPIWLKHPLPLVHRRYRVCDKDLICILDDVVSVLVAIVLIVFEQDKCRGAHVEDVDEFRVRVVD
jgi:hypothetical protein